MSKASALAKLTRPKPARVLDRERLFAQVSARANASVVFVHAVAGAGKSTLAASYAERLRVPTLWFRVDSEDEDPASLFLHLKLAATALGVGAAARLPLLVPEVAAGIEIFSRRFHRQLFGMLGARFLLVFDDCHEVGDNSVFFRLLHAATDELPPGGQVLLLSRNAPPPAFARRRANSELTEVDTNALALTDEEAISMAQLHGRADLSNDQICELRASVGAWVTGFVLALRALPSAGALAPNPKTPNHLLFDYFTVESFDRLLGEEQLLLLRLAVLPWMTAESSRELTGQADASSVLDSLVRNHRFTTRQGDAKVVFRFHPLFREFLLHRAAEVLPASKLRSLREHAAKLIEREGAPADAFALAVQAQAWEHARNLVIGNAAMILAQGRHRSLSAWLNALPAGLVESDVALSCLMGSSLLPDDPEAAYAQFERAYRRAVAGEDPTLVVSSWAGMVDAVFKGFRGFDRIDAAFDEFERHVVQHLKRLSIAERGRVVAIAFLALVFRQPNHPRVIAWTRPIRIMSRLVPNRQVRHLLKLQLATSHLWRGELEAAHAIARRLQPPSRDFESDPFSAIVIALIQASCHLHLAHSVDCISAVECGLGIATRSGLHVWNLTLHGIAAASSLGAGNYELARSSISRMGELLDEDRVVEHSHMLCLMAWQGLADGKPKSALDILELALDTVLRGGVPYFRGISLLVAAEVYASCQRPKDAMACLDRVPETVVVTGNPMLEWMRLLMTGRVAEASGDRTGALTALAAGLRLGREHGYMHFYFWPRETMSALLDMALTNRLETGYVSRLIAHNSLPPPLTSHAMDWPWPVKVFTLGGFRIELDGEPMASFGKVQKAPLNLLKALIAMGGREVSERRLVDELWPNSEGDAGQQAFATTLSRLRKIIGTAAIARQDGKLSIQGQVVRCDVQVLAWMLDQSRADRATALAAIRLLYLGPFLSSDDEPPWALPMRERMHRTVISTVLAAARDDADAGRHDDAISTCELGLRIDDLVEGFYGVAMRSLVATGRCADAALLYRQCQHKLSRRLGVSPSPATREAYLSSLTRPPGS